MDLKEPIIQFNYDSIEKMIIFKGIDSGSGIQTIDIYDDEKLIFSSNESVAQYELKPRDKLYLIYANAQDNVGNILKKEIFLNVSIQQDKPILHDCSNLNNCSDNGKCNQEYGVCQCFSEFIGEDCSEKLSIQQLLSKPVEYALSYYESNSINEYNLIFKFQNESSEYLLIDIEKTSSKDASSSIQFTYNNSTSIDAISLNASQNLNEIKLSLKSNISQTVELAIKTTSFKLYVNELVEFSNLNILELKLKTFIPEDFIHIIENETCYNFSSNINYIQVNKQNENDSLIWVESVSKRFIDLNLIDRMPDKIVFEVNSFERFNYTDLAIVF